MKIFKTLTLSVLTFGAIAISTQALAKKPAKSPNLVEVAISVNSQAPFAGTFDTLLLLAQSDPEIAEVLTSNGQYTVFAPTDDAFEMLMAEAASKCLMLDNNTVNAVLKYHVAKGRRDAADVTSSSQIRTLLGAFFDVSDVSGAVITDGAGENTDIIVTDVMASNGIIHAVNAVLLPFELPDEC